MEIPTKKIKMEDFRHISVYPRESDLNRREFDFVRPNKIVGAYEDVNHYLDVQFRLIREDLLIPIVRGLREYKDTGKSNCKGVHLYPNCKIGNIEITEGNQMIYQLNFDTNTKGPETKYKNRFMFGSLLLFTKNEFETFSVGTVFNRDLENGRLFINLIKNDSEPEIFNQPLVMAECEAYFPPYYHVMKALKEFSESDFPMKNFIVDGNTTIDFPTYVKEGKHFNIFGYSVNLTKNGWPHHSICGFDEYQFDAFKTALTSNFAMIQGPPGTGKTYIGLKIIEVLLNNIKIEPYVVKTPILLVCYTNHALDQFLEGVLKFTRKIVRVGGQSKSEVLKPFNLRGRENENNLRREGSGLFPAMNHCRNEMRKILLQLKKKMEEKEMIDVPQQVKETYEMDIKILENDYRSKAQQYEELQQLEDFHVVKNCLVVGMTTTCAARLQSSLLKNLSPAIVIVEEAAEVLEAHIVVSLSKKCEHVILIGDHKQLKPSAAVYELSKKYNMNVSLFERMINNNMHCPQLKIQHRMRPEISSLIVPSIYPDLKNHESVLKYPSVNGITKNIFFIDHDVLEENADSFSKKNKHEAEFITALCIYILQQGYDPNQIVILTTYTGQLFLLKEMKNYHSIMKNVKVTIVDKYQGEESDIILLSLVRSNYKRKIGFLETENRVCVALSRAKIGLYIIGNMDILSDCSLWRNIKEELAKQEAIGKQLTLYCSKHDVHTQVSCKSDFINVAEGGCNNYCHKMMNCGHRCQLLCHKIDMEHSEKKCRERCLRKCAENHQCEKYCYENCGLCTKFVERNLPCGHKVALQCYQDYVKHLCQVEVSVVLKHCSHQVNKKCYELIDSVKCTFPCEDRLECGHQCVQNCHKTNDPDHLEYKCRKVCKKINRECSQQHKCEKLCFQVCGKCKKRVDFTLNCGHQVNLQCTANRDRVNCHAPCERKCLDCKTKCPKKCFEDCKPCMHKVTKIIPNCGHKIKIECSIIPERKLCFEKCQRDALCGHKCNSICGKECGTERCVELVKSNRVLALCGHGYANVPCWRRNEVIDAEELLQYCTEPCTEMLKCEDRCTGTCGSCSQGRLHKICEQKCGNVLVCGHSCTFPCRNVCPPCNKKCRIACKHSKCPKNCGVPCVPCKEKCEWNCIHWKCEKECGDMCEREPCYKPCPKKLKCSHDCIGFCGEPCPPKCRICDEEVTMILFGHEDEEDARFVLLEDCGHIIESQAMDQYINMPAEKGEILMKLCPLCKTPISKTLRYMNQVKKVYRDIENIKKKIYGDEKEMQQLRDNLTEKLQNVALKKEQLSKKEFRLIPNTLIVYKQKLKDRGKKSFISKQELRAMHFFTDVFLSIVSRLDDLKESPESEQLRIYKNLESILKRVNPEALLINMQQVEETQRELNRYHRLVDYGVYLKQPEYLYSRKSANVISIDADIINILHGLKCFDDQQDARIGELFEKLRKEIKASQTVSQEEKRMINAAMAKDFYGGINSTGHWFNCTNGHYYCITECGGAMQESICPECREKIGGNNHRLVDTARLASDMDGATRPAWSSGADVRNFHLF